MNEEKWWPKNPTWLGREPAYFNPGNVTVSDGNLHLMFRKQELPEVPKDKGYHTYTSASVVSKATVEYGYFEIRAKPMRSAGSSAFWLIGSEDGWKTELDVFELGGGAVGFERKYNMNLHVFETPQEKKHWHTEGTWLAPWDLADDFHVYGLEWDEHNIKYYVDGVTVRQVENTHWNNQVKMIFDSEAMFDWLGVPKDEDLPSTYSIDYVRAWQRSTPPEKASSESHKFTTTGGRSASSASAVAGASESMLRVALEEQRLWTDRSGKHAMRAKLLAVKSGWGLFLRTDGTKLSVPFDKFSEQDQLILREIEAKSLKP